MDMLGLYIHIPFCSAICSYCNFNRGLFDAELKARYVDALEREIRTARARLEADGPGVGATGLGNVRLSPRSEDAAAGIGGVRLQPDQDLNADTIYFGGGTPSLLEPGEIERLIAACRDVFDVTRDAEVTLETNPETSSLARMEGFRAAGVNRISFGVQSFREQELRRLGRIHTVDRALAALSEARAAGFDNISLDLMMWLPQQTMSDWQESIEGLIASGPEHASLYLLELYPNAPLKEEMARGNWSLAPEDDAAEMYLWSLERLDAAGYRQYEISNVCRLGRESRHNLKYWADGEWLGFGCGAHSTRGGARWKNVSGTADYVARIAAGLPVQTERREMTPEERLEEALFTGLRLAAGIDMAATGARYGFDVWRRYGEALQPFVDEGLVIRDGTRLRLSRAGMLVANEIMRVFV